MRVVSSQRVERRELLLRASKLYPTFALRKRWVRSKERLGTTPPRVDIGIERADTSRAMRSLKEAGIHLLHEEFKVPEFLKKLLRLH